jgi:ABC-2 type transport system permease protein
MISLVATEWRKLRTQRTAWLLAAAGPVLVAAGVSGLLARPHPEITDLASQAVAHVGLVSVLSLVLGVLVMAGEYRHRTIDETFLTTPRRYPVLTAKLVTAIAAAGAVAAVSSALAIAVAALWLRDDGGLHLGDAALWRTVGGGIAWNATYAVIGVGIAALARSLAGGIALALGWIAVVEGIVGQLLGDSMARWLPFSAGMALGRVGSPALSQGTAAAVLVAYAVVIASAGYRVTMRRDVRT